MPSFAHRLYSIRIQVGGFREKTGFEHTAGPTRQMQNSIAMPSAESSRILGQLEFALHLSQAHDGKFDGEIDKALGILEHSLQNQGTLTREACRESEHTLLPLHSASKEYTVLCAAHAHLDMNWKWGWQETVAMTLATFRTMLSLMKEYPDFTFSQSQASVYHIVEHYNPAMMDEIKQRIQEGRWEVTASAWVETDKNMPSTESLLRHIRYTKDYLANTWDVDPASLNIDFSPDTFGHSAHIPEIDHYGGVKYMYHCRGFNERHVLYRWRSPSGNEVLGHCEPFWYNSGITADIGVGAVELASLCAGLKTSLIVYGVGDHGGGPTRRDIEQIMDMAGWPVFPQVKFGTFAEYFKAAETVRDKLPVVDREINFIFTGCYTTQSRIKLGNRHSEAALVDAQACDAMSTVLTGKQYPPQRYVEAWQNVLFTHFHDILTGACVRDSREHAMGLYAHSMAVAQSMREAAALNIAEQIDTSSIDVSDVPGTQSEGAGAGYGVGHFQGNPSPERGRGHVRIFHVFNPSPYARSEHVEFTVWDWTYDMRRIEVTDCTGKTLPHQLVDKNQVGYYNHWYFRCIVPVEIPSFGYTTVVLKEAPMDKRYPFYFHPLNNWEAPHKAVVLENECIRVEFDSKTGSLRSLYDKETAAELLAQGSTAGLVLNWAEKATNNAWKIGRFLASEPVVNTTRIIESTGNPLRDSLTLEQTILSSKLKTTISLDKGLRSLAYHFTITWNETAESHAHVPVLCFSLHLGKGPDFLQSDVPGGIQKRPEEAHDYPGLSYMAAVNGPNALAFITDCKYGYRGNDGNLSVTLINATANPDPDPERGEHAIRLWVTPASSDPKALAEIAGSYCSPVNIVSGGRHKGKLPLHSEIFAFEAAGTVLSSLGSVDRNTILVRGYETTGINDTVRLKMPHAIKGARMVDLDGKSADGDITVNGTSLTFTVAPHRIFGVLIDITGGYT